jgi:hypothetical protein
MIQLVEHHVEAEPQLLGQLESAQGLQCRVGPAGQALRLGEAVLQQEGLDLLLD